MNRRFVVLTAFFATKSWLIIIEALFGREITRQLRARLFGRKNIEQQKNVQKQHLDTEAWEVGIPVNRSISDITNTYLKMNKSNGQTKRNCGSKYTSFCRLDARTVCLV